ncbi:diaminohydroxyphosphoribosylaminopyrimidine deaminase [Caloramator quimbayensis]|uniref:Riboflavin biosynthesis protein RibD n=1 Tax=Caloramator quimbayensis TaxID=1147123 RepID=A0A1T4WMR9_9CLOT|nr:bifunctional diaminohydroxyphosphoribosylaminopyrimidine deaminase/5-amino-6-(5-phosphoribosylamino)uracil reductase RibD [Caloramator quimbayensis]SKA78437.1 diaminohydroxyphosphoribosylaminopyrimidine deaminase [Caloramator quimbayensis]
MDEFYMKRALELAKLGEGYTNPNPLVGAVIVKDGKIIGEGYHERYGGPHAEINAFKNAKDDVKGSTLYVTLEPCSHYGKTPPCADAIIEKKIKRVVAAMKDPNPLVAGKGLEKLIKSGIEVRLGVLEDEAKKLNEIFIKYITTKTPFVILKSAMTLDGKIASFSGDSKWITNEKSRDYVHSVRQRVSAIMAGIGTVINDNPHLTARKEGNVIKDLTRIIVDTNLKIPLNSNVLDTKVSKTIIACSEYADNNKIEKLKNLGVYIIKTPLKDNRVDIKYLIKSLGELNIDSVLLEGGGILNFSALKEGIVDKVMIFIAPKIIGGESSKTPVEGEGFEFIKDAVKIEDISIKSFDEDILYEGYIKR